MTRRAVEEPEVAAPDRSTDGTSSAHREMDAVIAMLAHEVRGHLNEIVLLQGLLLAGGRQGSLSPEQQARVRQMGRAATRVAALFDMLTGLARRDRTDLARQPIHVGRLAAAVLEQLAPELESVHLAVQVDPDLPIVRGDPAVVEGILRTLVQTAVRYSTASDGQVSLRVRATPPGLAIDVGGPGVVSPSSRPPSGDSTGERVPAAGIGLALYILRRSVEPLGGSAELVTDGDGHAALRVTLSASDDDRGPGRSSVAR